MNRLPKQSGAKRSIGIIQMKMTADQKANLKNAIHLVEQAAANGAQIICLPELFRTIYFPQYVDVPKDDYAEAIPGETTQVFCRLAKKHRVVIVVPIFEKESADRYFNSAVVIDDDGQLLEPYHKIHIPQDPLFYEKNYFTPGQSYKIYKTSYATFAVLICYDQWFPEAARVVSLMGAELIVYPTAIGTIAGYHSLDGDWHNAWETVMRGHAIANAVHIAAINRVGAEDQLHFWGQSFVSDSFGQILKKASGHQEEMIICPIDLSHNQRIREGWGFYKNRRPDTYHSLTER